MIVDLRSGSLQRQRQYQHQPLGDHHVAGTSPSEASYRPARQRSDEVGGSAKRDRPEPAGDANRGSDSDVLAAQELTDLKWDGEGRSGYRV